MATTAATVELELQNKLRIGTAQVAISDANLYALMNNVQLAVNYAFKLKIATGTFKCASSVTTINATTVTVAADCDRVMVLYEATRTVMYLPSWKDIAQYDRDWQIDGAARSEVWSEIGHHILAVYPASTITYNCVYLQETTLLNAGGDEFGIPDEDVHLVTELCEIVWLTHLGHLPEAMKQIEEFKKSVETHLEWQQRAQQS